MNESNLKEESLSGKKRPALAKSVLWQNRALVLLLLAVILVIALFQSLREAAGRLKEQLLALLNSLLSRPQQPESPPPQDNTPAAPPRGWEKPIRLQSGGFGWKR
ncbi:hypothetical protein LJK88_38665 [Paenibacillus sp. P26]|nr:hypothetical protein LJK88_38665 [Paenibacillus sp. P26]